MGFGERYDSLDQRGQALDAVVFEQYKSQGVHGRTYLPMPFAHVVGGDGWGFHVRTSRRTWYSSEGDQLTVEVALGDEAVVDLGIYEGSPTEVLKQFLDEVGRAEELPEWVFRLWASGNEWNTQELVMARMDAHRDLAIPVGAMVIEAWSDEEGITIWRDARYEVTADGSAHRAERFRVPAGRRLARSEGDDRRAARARDQGHPLADPLAEDGVQHRAGRRRRRGDGPRRTRSTGGGRYGVPQPRLVVPARR